MLVLLGAQPAPHSLGGLVRAHALVVPQPADLGVALIEAQVFLVGRNGKVCAARAMKILLILPPRERLALGKCIAKSVVDAKSKSRVLIERLMQSVRVSVSVLR
jgi:hypothetical protein